MGKKHAKTYRDLRRQYQEQGNADAIAMGRTLLESQQSLSVGDRERLLGYLEGSGKTILPEPQAALTKASKMPGLDGQKMSKSYNNTLSLRESPESVEKKIRTMPTDTNRVRRTDPGDPARCPVWQFHEVYSDDTTKQWVQEGCRSAGIGCIECKQPVIAAVQAELAPIQQRAAEFEADRGRVREILREGADVARQVAKATMVDVMEAMRFTHHL
jgi:tryptophanyl-tRNA synthetase